MRTLIILATLLLAAPAAAQQRQTASLKFTTTKPAAPTGVILDADYFAPGDEDAKPPAVRRVVTRLADGARYDTSVPGRCEASDAELMIAGAAACPPSS